MDNHGDIELVEFEEEPVETSGPRERTSPRTSEQVHSRYISHVVASLPSSLAAKSKTGVKFSRKRINRENFLLHRILSLLAEEERADHSERSTGGATQHAGSFRQRMSNRVSPDFCAPKEEPEVDEDDLNNLDLGHHRVDLDNVETEEDRARTVELIRALPCRVGIKKRLLHKILTQKSVKASGIVLLKETRRKKVKQLSNFLNNWAYTLAPWGKSIRDIEGHHGAGVASYFLFLRWLFGFNIALFVLMAAFILVPMIIIGDTPLTASSDSIVNTSYYCSLNYTVVEQKGISYLLDFIQGTGWMEKTLAFHGYYVPNLSGTYNLPLAYVLTVLACMLVSLALMARYTSKSFEAALLNSIDTNFEYSNKVFGAWDYGLIDAEAAKLKQKGIHYDLQSEMMEQTFMRTKMERLENKCAMFRLYLVRTLINLLITFLLGAAAYAIVKVTSWSTSYASSHQDATGTDEWLLLLAQYLPSLTITACNALLPIIFELVVELEDYSQAFIIKITLIRTVFLRLASIVVLLVTLFTEIQCGPENECRTTVEPGCSDIRCWESYVGQQLYKLVILDFVVTTVKVFAVEIPQKFLVQKCQCGLIQKIGPPEFNITSNVLDLIYAQCLIWLGFLLCPLLPGMMVVKSFILFFVKKVSAMVACPPSEKPYRASRINTFFMIILLLTYFLCAVPVLYAIFGIHPSRGCGPFRLLDYMNEAIENAAEDWPLFLSNSYDLFTSAAFSGTIIILLCMIIYYLNTMSKAHNQRANLLKEQLIMEGRDKQFLLNKLQEQEKERNPRKAEPPPRPKPKKKSESPAQPRRNKKQERERQNARANDPDEGSFSPPHYVDDNPDW